MKRKNAKTLPKTIDEVANGGVYEQRVRCGKPNCKCVRGELHIGLFYFFTRVDGKLIKTYIPKIEVARIRELVEAASDERSSARKIKSSNRKLMTEFRDALREREATIE